MRSALPLRLLASAPRLQRWRSVAPAREPMPFALKDLEVSLSPQHSVRLVVPLSDDDVLDHFIASGRGDVDPFFCSVWHSSMAIASLLLVEQPRLALGKAVLDVGCGLGLAGIAAALAGARSTVLADNEPLALRCALMGAASNGLLLRPEAALASTLTSTSDGAGLGLLTALRLDWHAPPAELAGAFELMLAADVLYDKTAPAPVAALALHCLAPGGLLVLSDPPHRTPALREAFGMAVAGQLEVVSDTTALTDDPEGAGNAAAVRTTIFRRL